MASPLKNLSVYDEHSVPDAGDLIFGIVVSEWNANITHALYEGCYKTLVKHGVSEEHIHSIQVPGSFELPAGAKLMIANKKVDAVICLGCIIRGETSHNVYISQAVATGIANLSMVTNRPCIFGVLTPDNEQQALDRAGGKHGNKGIEAAVAAIRMGSLAKSMATHEKRIGFSR